MDSLKTKDEKLSNLNNNPEKESTIKKSSEESPFIAQEEGNKTKVSLLTQIIPFSQDNMVGVGTILGFLFHGIINKNGFISFSRDEFNWFDSFLMTIYLASFALILSGFFYQLFFWAFRVYNQKLVNNEEHRVILDRCIQIMFGLCIGGLLLYNWRIVDNESICIRKTYCPDSEYSRRIIAWRDHTCDKEGTFCKSFFYRIPILFLTFRSILGAMFIYVVYERKSRLLISLSVHKPNGNGNQIKCCKKNYAMNMNK